MKEKTVCFTGHRVIPENVRDDLQRKLRETLHTLIQSGYRDFMAGGALGFDTLAALAVLEMKKQYPQIRLLLALPYKAQAHSWPKDDQQIYAAIREQADECVCLAENYYKGCLHVRNRYLVDHSSVCICYLTKGSSGTRSTVRYAQRQSAVIINLA